jgi:hypothetical protein
MEVSGSNGAGGLVAHVPHQSRVGFGGARINRSTFREYGRTKSSLEKIAPSMDELLGALMFGCVIRALAQLAKHIE